MSTHTKKIIRPLHSVFTNVPRYDLINHIFTCGQDVKWRREAAKECLSGKPGRILDLACGTGDLAINIARRTGPDVEVNGLDFSQPMLDLAQQKARNQGQRVNFINGDAGNLPFSDKYFDCVGISFAFRNLTYKHPEVNKHIGEVLRVLKPGGRFVIVESSQPERRFIRAVDHFYLRTFVYRLGWWLSGNRNAFNYLTLSASRYFTANELKDLLLGAGFSEVGFRHLLFGAVAIHVAIK